MGLNISQEQKQIISVAMKQSLYVLSLPVQDLQEYLNDLSAENPLIDLDETYGRPPVEFSTVTQVDNDFSGALFQTWYASGDRDDEPRERCENAPAAEESFTEHLHAQLDQDSAIPKKYLPICHFLVESLNRRGYLDDSIEVLAEIMGVPLDDAVQALYAVQSLTPTGVGARSLQECLILQLAEGRNFNAYTLSIIKNHLPLLAKNQIHAIAQQLGIGDSAAQVWCDAVRALNPIPSRGFHTPTENYCVIPDAYVVFEGEKAVVNYNDASLPRVRINQEYCRLLRESPDKEATKYLQRILRQAERTKQDLDYRETTLVSVIDYIIRRQYAYLKGTERTPALLTVNEVAQALERHPSTISRAVKDKYISCEGRTIPLRELFHTPVNSAVSVSRPAVKKQLKYLVDGEDPAAPLSDERLRALLLDAGIDISRRTVAAYREELGIPRASVRRRRP